MGGLEAYFLQAKCMGRVCSISRVVDVAAASSSAFPFLLPAQARDDDGDVNRCFRCWCCRCGRYVIVVLPNNNYNRSWLCHELVASYSTFSSSRRSTVVLNVNADLGLQPHIFVYMCCHFGQSNCWLQRFLRLPSKCVK